MGPGSRAQAQTPRVASTRTMAVQARWRGRTGYWRDTEVGDQTRGPESKFCYVDLDLSEVLSSMRSYRRITRVQSYGTGSAWMPTQASRIHCVCSHFRGTFLSLDGCVCTSAARVAMSTKLFPSLIGGASQTGGAVISTPLIISLSLAALTKSSLTLPDTKIFQYRLSIEMY
jgi:hypothetical protein